ncbi:MAG: VanW family protein [Rikenellaceae bacterium]
MSLKRRNFSAISPFTYAISREKEICKRKIKDVFQRKKFTKTISHEKLPHVVWSYSSGLIKTGKGIDPTLQINKVDNIIVAAAQIDGLVISPGEIFSFWQRVGNPSLKRGFRQGRVITQGVLKSGVGGGLCNLANTINLLVLNSSLTITELHKHSDALAPDNNNRIPFGAGTSVSYNYIDYRFRNDTNQQFQIFLRCENNTLYGELRCQTMPQYTYRLLEEDHHFKKIDNHFYRFSKVYRETIDVHTDMVISKELIWDNKSRVMFDYDLIPKELVREHK